MALFKRKAAPVSGTPARPPLQAAQLTVGQALTELVPLVKASITERGSLSFRREGHKCSVVPQQDGMLTLNVTLSSSIVLSLRPPPPGHGLTAQSQMHGAPLCWYPDGLFSPVVWLENPAHKEALKAIGVQHGEYVHIYRNGLSLRMQPLPGVQMIDRLDAVMRLLPLLPPDETKAPSFKSHAVPAELRPLRTAALKWGIADDSDRSDAISSATRVQLERLVNKVEPLLAAIDALLDADDSSDEARMLGDLKRPRFSAAPMRVAALG